MKTFLKKNLSKEELKFYKLDKQILKHRLKFGSLSNNNEILNELGISSMQYAGRVKSLSSRGYCDKLETYKKSKLSKTDRFTNKYYDAMNELYYGVHPTIVQSKYNISVPTLTKIKKHMYQIRFSPKIKPIKEVKSNTYTNENGLNKEIARVKMVNSIIDSDVEGTILTLPYSTCKIEKKILKHKPNSTFLGVENVKETYNDLRMTVKREELPMETYFGNFSDKIYGALPNTYAHIIADYCGMITTYAKEIEYMIKHNLVKRGGYIFITVAMAIRGAHPLNELVKGLSNTIINNSDDMRCNSYKSIETYINRLIGFDYEFVELFSYSDKKDKGVGAPMVLITLKRL